MKCKKCGNEFEGKFCPECGEPAEQTTSQQETAEALGEVAAKPKKKKGKGCLIVIGVLLVLSIIGAIAGGDTKDESSVNTQSTTSEAVSSTSVPPTYEATPESMQQLFADTSSSDYEELSSSIVAENGINVCNISYKNTGVAWDESAFVNGILCTFIDFQRTAYNVEGIDAVRFEVWQDMTDDRGNTESDLCYQFMMDKEAFSLYNWDTMGGRPIFDQMQRDCSEFYIHPGILKNVNADKVIYVS